MGEYLGNIKDLLLQDGVAKITTKIAFLCPTWWGNSPTFDYGNDFISHYQSRPFSSLSSANSIQTLIRETLDKIPKELSIWFRTGSGWRGERSICFYKEKTKDVMKKAFTRQKVSKTLINRQETYITSVNRYCLWGREEFLPEGFYAIYDRKKTIFRMS